MDIAKTFAHCFTGPFPECLGNIGTLVKLLLSENNITGPLPPSFGENLPIMNQFKASSNPIGGETLLLRPSVCQFSMHAWSDTSTSSSVFIVIIRTRFSSPRGLGALQQLLKNTLPSLPVLALSPQVKRQFHRIQIFVHAIIPVLHRLASPSCTIEYPLCYRTSVFAACTGIHSL